MNYSVHVLCGLAERQHLQDLAVVESAGPPLQARRHSSTATAVRQSPKIKQQATAVVTGFTAATSVAPVTTSENGTNRQPIEFYRQLGHRVTAESSEKAFDVEIISAAPITAVATLENGWTWSYS